MGDAKNATGTEISRSRCLPKYNKPCNGSIVKMEEKCALGSFPKPATSAPRWHSTTSKILLNRSLAADSLVSITKTVPSIRSGKPNRTPPKPPNRHAGRLTQVQKRDYAAKVK